MVELILEFSDWVLRASPELGMEVFVADTENSESLPRDKVARFLGGIDDGLEVRYLEHIISELNDMTPEFHNRLVQLMVERLKAEPRGEGWEGGMERLVGFLKESRQYGRGKAFGLIPKNGQSSECQGCIGVVSIRLTDESRQILHSTRPRLLCSVTWGSTSRLWRYTCSR